MTAPTETAPAMNARSLLMGAIVPATQSVPAKGPLHQLLRASRHHLRMVRVLVVDDEPAVRTALERALRLEAYDVELAADGREALDRMSDGTPPDAVVLDVAMPHVDGLEVCRRLR